MDLREARGQEYSMEGAGATTLKSLFQHLLVMWIRWKGPNTHLKKTDSEQGLSQLWEA